MLEHSLSRCSGVGKGTNSDGASACWDLMLNKEQGHESQGLQAEDLLQIAQLKDDSAGIAGGLALLV